VERLETLLLGVEGIEPEENAFSEVAAVGVDGAAVPDVVGCIWKGRA